MPDTTNTSSGRSVQMPVTRDPVVVLSRALVNRQKALNEIIALLGPETVCSCEHAANCGLRDEAAEARRIATATVSS